MEQQYTRSRIPLKPFYAREDAEHSRDPLKLPPPGQYPFTRGIRARAGWTWIHRELSGQGEGIDVIGDSPTQAYLDPDHPLARNAIGTQGVSLCCLQDYRDLYRDLPLVSITVSNSLPPVVAIAALYVVARENGVHPEDLRGSLVQAPFFAEDCGYAVNMPFDLRLRLTCDAIAFCAEKMPKFHAFLEDTYFPSEAGLDPVEEMALGFVEIRHVVRELLKRGLPIDSFAPRIAILVNCGMDFFEEIAKIRATRRLFARMMKEEFGAEDPRSMAVVITCHTSGLSLTAQQPVNNIVRGAIQTLALALAGVQAIEISAFDEAYRTPTPESHLVGLRTQQVVQLETGATKVLDPLGGSYFLESLTDETERRIREMVHEIESKGDPGELSDRGWFKAFFEEVMARYARRIAEGELKDIAQTKIEPYWDRIEAVRSFKERRNKEHVASSLRLCRKAAESPGENLMFSTIEALEAGATASEIAGMFRLAYSVPYDPHGFEGPPF
ncbi:MAG: acyl-CoA mutase large subunit family protein [Deltaproteobacteria bacterium]|nr:acyl-CoA mutase large subunit family protein [Deltaproteobacteria bacterium]